LSAAVPGARSFDRSACIAPEVPLAIDLAHLSVHRLQEPRAGVRRTLTLDR
jgi:hypothetical protein